LSSKLPKEVGSGVSIVRLLGLASHEREGKKVALLFWFVFKRKENGKTGVVRFRMVTSLSGPQVLVSSLVELALQSTPIRQMPLIKRTVFVEAASDKPAHVITEGSNIEWLCTK
jgi:hypothetical protein